MEIISGIFEDQEQMKKETEKLLKQGYKIINSSISFEPIGYTNTKIYNKIWYYIILQKEEKTY